MPRVVTTYYNKPDGTLGKAVDGMPVQSDEDDFSSSHSARRELSDSGNSDS